VKATASLLRRVRKLEAARRPVAVDPGDAAGLEGFVAALDGWALGQGAFVIAQAAGRATEVSLVDLPEPNPAILRWAAANRVSAADMAQITAALERMAAGERPGAFS
jgi:hypothetical protein